MLDKKNYQNFWVDAQDLFPGKIALETNLVDKYQGYFNAKLLFYLMLFNFFNLLNVGVICWLKELSVKYKKAEHFRYIILFELNRVVKRLERVRTICRLHRAHHREMYNTKMVLSF